MYMFFWLKTIIQSSTPPFHSAYTQNLSITLHDSWQTLRAKMENQQRVTVILKQEDGTALHIRKATRAEPLQKERGVVPLNRPD